MKKHLITIAAMLLLMTAIPATAQSADAYAGGGDHSFPLVPTAPAGIDAPAASAGLLDPSRFSVSHSMSFMAGGTQMSNVQSQSVYSTMFQYKFNAPVVLSLNFDMPIHSTFNQYSNFNQDNLQSFDYFRNMPVDASIAWMPSERFMMRFSVLRMPEMYSYSGFRGRHHW